MNTVNIFAHKGVIGIDAGEAGDYSALLTDPEAKHQVGLLADARNVRVQPEAYELITKLSHSNDDIGELMVFQRNDGIVIVGWLGTTWKKAVFVGRDELSKNCNPTLLKDRIDSAVTTPLEFVKWVDGLPEGLFDEED